MTLLKKIRYTIEVIAGGIGNLLKVSLTPWFFPLWGGISKQLEPYTPIQKQLENCTEGCFVYPKLDWVIDQEIVVGLDLILVCRRICSGVSGAEKDPYFFTLKLKKSLM